MVQWSAKVFERPNFDLIGKTQDTHNCGRQTKPHGIPKNVLGINAAALLSEYKNGINISDKPDWIPPRSVKLQDQVRERVRYLR